MQGYPPRLLALSERCPQNMLNRDYWSIRDFVLVKEVGSGAASTVYYAICRKSTQQVAIKMYLKSKLSKLNRRQVEREINIHSSLSHPHIIDFYAAFEDDDRIYLVQEYAAGGDLFDDVKRRGGRLQEREVVQHVLYPYLTALVYLHKRGIIHRDIKPENTVFTRERVLKVTDFGLAINAATERPVTRLGTLDYMAPEVLRCPDKHSPEDNKDRVDLEYDASVDAWAMGVLAYELVVGRPPFGMSCREATMRAIVSASPSIPEWMSPAAADFIRAALQRTPKRRLPVEQLLQHPWITSHVINGSSSSGSSRSTAAAAAARNLSCGSEAAAATAAAAGVAGTASAAAVGCGAPATVARSLFYHPGGPYKHLLAAQPSCNSASASEVGGGGIGGAAAAAVNGYGSDHRPAKRQVQRCQSAVLDGPGGGGGVGSAAAAMAPPGAVAQHGAAAAQQHRLYDMSYWMTDGNGFSRPDPLVGLGINGSIAAQLQQHQQQPSLAEQQQQQRVANSTQLVAWQQQQQQPQLAVVADSLRWAVAIASSGDASPISSPMAMCRAQDFYTAQVAGAAGAGAVFGDGSVLQEPVVGGGGQTTQKQRQRLMDAQRQMLQQQQQQQQQQHQNQMLAYEQEQGYQQQLLQLQHSQQQQQQMAMLAQQQQQQALMIGMQQQLQLQHQGHGASVSGSGESTNVAGATAVTAAAVEPSIPSVTAADCYKLHLEDLCTMWEVGGRTPAVCRTSPGPRGLSRSFTARYAGRTASSAGLGSSAASGGGSAAAAAAAALTGGGGPQSPAAVRLLRNGTSSSSSSGSIKRRTPDTHDWDSPQLTTAFSAQQLQIQFLPAGRTGSGGVASAAAASGLRPGSPLARSSDAFAAAGGAAAYYMGGGAAAAAASGTPTASVPATPFSPYAMAASAAAAAAATVGAGLQTSAATPPPQPQQLSAPQLGSSLSFTSFGSGSGRPSRFSKAFRRVDSLDPTDGGFGFGGLGSQGSDGSGCSGSSPLPTPLPLARCSGATAAIAALDQLTLASGAGMAAAAAAAAVINSSPADCADGAAAALVAAALQAASCDMDVVAGDAGGGNLSYNALSDSSNGSSVAAAASTALTAASIGGTSGSGFGSGPFSTSACSYGYSAASGCTTVTGGITAAVGGGASPSHRAPSLTTCGTFSSAAQSMAALRLSLPTSLLRVGVPTAGSTTGSSSGVAVGAAAGGGAAAGPCSHPLTSPLVTPWSTPMNSPRGLSARMPRVLSQPPAAAASSFDVLMDLMESEGVLTATGEGGTAAAAAMGIVLESSRSGSLDASDWGVRADAAAAAAAAVAEGQAAMQIDGAIGGGGGGGSGGATVYFNRGGDHEGHLATSAGAAGRPPVHVSACGSVPQGQGQGQVQVQAMSPEDRWALAWAAAAAVSSGGTGGGSNASSRTAPPAPTTPPSTLGRAGSFGVPLGSGAVHTPSPLGRDQPHQQARAAAIQQHIRSRSLNRFQLEQMGLAPASSTSGGGAAVGGGSGMPSAAVAALPSPFAVSPPISPRGATGDSGHGMFGGDALPTASSVTGGGGGGVHVGTNGGSSGGCSGGGSSGGAFGNRLGQQMLSPSASLRGLSHNAVALQATGAPHRSYPHAGCGMGAVQCGGTAVTSPSPLGLRCSRSRASNASSDDTSGHPLGTVAGCSGEGASDRPLMH